MNNYKGELVDQKLLKQLLKKYNRLFDVIPNPNSDGHPGVEIYYKHKCFVSNPVLFVNIFTKSARHIRVFVVDSCAPRGYHGSLCLYIKEVFGSLYIKDEAIIISDEFCIDLYDHNITIHNLSPDGTTPLYDIAAILRRKLLSSIINDV